MDILNENYYDDLLATLEEIFQEQERQVIAVICNRLKAVGKLNPTSIKQLVNSAKYTNADLKKMQQAIKKSSTLAGDEIDRIFAQAASDCKEYADTLAYQAMGGDYAGNVFQLAKAAAKRHKDSVLNLSDTYAFKTDGKIRTIRQQYITAVNRATTAITTGTVDYNTAIRNTVKEMVNSGLRVRPKTGERIVEWESGYTRRADSSIRMNVLEGVRQLNQEILNDAGEKFANGYEISAHERPAPDHADIQGRQYKRTDYEQLNASLERPIGTLNCMHIAYPIIYGVTPPTYTDAELAEMKRRGEKLYIWKGKKYTGYECTQKQRQYETAIRRTKDRANALREAGDEIGARHEQKRVRELNAEYKAFSDHVGLRIKTDRTNVVAKSREDGIIKSEKIGGNSMTINNIQSPIEQRNTGKGKPGAVYHYDIELNNRQQALLESLPEYNSRVSIPKDTVNMTDLAALTAKTGDEFALFTKGGDRLVVRGNGYMVSITEEEARTLNENGYVWSGHTHPGSDFNCLMASDGDYLILNCFKQKTSVIYNSVGNYLQFNKEE